MLTHGFLSIFISVLFSTLFASVGLAQEEEFPTSAPEPVPVGFIRKMVVFPIVASKAQSKIADATWWKVREELTDTKRILVASKRFLIQKDVFQARTVLQPADAILLGQLLDADALMLLQLQNKELSARVYGRYDGGLIWSNSIQMHPSLPLEQQMEDVGQKLARDFIAAIPYHGTQILDPLINKPTYEEGDVRLAKVDVGSNTRTAEGDPVQWIRVERSSGAALFPAGSRMEIAAEGQVVRNDNGILLIEIKRVKDLNLLQTHSLVRLPNEADHLNGTFALPATKGLAPELRYTPLPQTKPEASETKPLFAALTAIASAVAFFSWPSKPEFQSKLLLWETPRGVPQSHL